MLDGLHAQGGSSRTLVVDLVDEGPPIDVPGARVKKVEGPRQWLSFPTEASAAPVVAAVAAAYDVADLSIQEPDIEEVIRDLYSRLWHTGTHYLSPLFAELWQAAPDDDARRRVVVDQIASYTDVTARRLHDLLFDRSLTHVTAADTPLPGLGSEL